MATREVGKSGRAPKRPARGAKAIRKAAKKPRPRPAPKPARKLASPAPRRALKARRQPESLRLRTLAPSLTVRDIERSVDVYTRALGFVVVERWMEGGALLGVMLEAGACRIGLSRTTGERARAQAGRGRALLVRDPPGSRRARDPRARLRRRRGGPEDGALGRAHRLGRGPGRLPVHVLEDEELAPSGPSGARRRPPAPRTRRGSRPRCAPGRAPARRPCRLPCAPRRRS